MLTHAWRSWRGGKAVAFLAVAALTAGIGSATAIYTVVNAVMLKPLPYPDGQRFVVLVGGDVKDPEHFSSLSSIDAQTFQAGSQAFDAFGWFRTAGQNLTFEGQPQHIEGVRITLPFVEALGVAPALGRWFHDDSGVVLSHILWQHLGADTAIVGKPLTLDGRAYTVSGVMPPQFRLPISGIPSTAVRADLWLALDPKEQAGDAYFAYARRKANVTLEAARADVERVASVIASADPSHHPGFTARLFDLRDMVIRDIRPTLFLLLGASVLLFFITCANTAGLLLARAVARSRETAIRVALGASRRSLAAHYFGETLPVAIVGAIGGLAVSLTLTPLIVSSVADYLPRSEDVGVDGSVLGFVFAAALIACALASLAPLWHALRTAPAEALSEGARGSASVRTRRFSQSLVVGETALAFALLAVSVALVVHLAALTRTSLGFVADNVLTFGVSAPNTLARDHNRLIAYQRRLVDGLKAVPGVEAVAFANQLPLDGCCRSTNVYPEGAPPELTDSQRTSLMLVLPDYFDTLRIPLKRGRLITDGDTSETLMPVVIDEAAARRYWPGDDPIGKFGRFNTTSGARFQVVGIVGDIRNDGLGAPPVPEVFLLHTLGGVDAMHFMLRTPRATSASLVTDIRQAIRAIDPDQPIHDVATLSAVVKRSVTLERAASLLTAFFAAAAVLMATLGVYGVVAYSVRQRTVEIGTRMALGATRHGVLALVVGEGLRMAGIGVGLGIVAALIAGPYLADLFKLTSFGVSPFLYSTSIVGLVAASASFVPAWRASLVSPMVAIRNESTSILDTARVRIRQAIAGARADGEASGPVLSALLGELASSVREADSFGKVMTGALDALQRRVGATSIALAGKTSADEFRGADISLPAGGFIANQLRHYPHPIAIDDRDLDAWMRWARSIKPERLAELEALRLAEVRLAAPLRTRTDTVGVLLLGPPSDRERYSAVDKEVVSVSADVFALMIENARLTERSIEQEKVRRDLAVAAEVQRRLLPPQPPKAGSVSFGAYTLPARTVGGDYYDLLDLGTDGLGMAVADVSGKGIAAALLMSVVQASLRVITSTPGVSASQLAGRMNGFLYKSTGANKYATFFYAQVARDGSCLRYVNAGHNPPYLVRIVNGAVDVSELAVGGMVIGLFPDADYEETQVALMPGDLIVAFTDGVTEALNVEGEEFGEDRVKAVLRDAARASADDVSSRLATAVREWMGTAEQHDDLTVVVAKIGEA